MVLSLVARRGNKPHLLTASAIGRSFMGTAKTEDDDDGGDEMP